METEGKEEILVTSDYTDRNIDTAINSCILVCIYTLNFYIFINCL